MARSISLGGKSRVSLPLNTGCTDENQSHPVLPVGCYRIQITSQMYKRKGGRQVEHW